MTNKRNGTLYVGVTSDLVRRVYDHRTGALAGFTKTYGCKLLVWYVNFDQIIDAIEHEKRIKAGSRKKKIILIETMNPEWRDLYHELI
jgi:predicted GIY-YIG superfamily endonuclease